MINIFRSNYVIVGMQWNGTITQALEIYENLKLFGMAQNAKDLKFEFNRETGLPSRWIIDINHILSPGSWLIIQEVRNTRNRHIDIVDDKHIKENYQLEFIDALEHDLDTYKIKLNPQNFTP